MLGWTPGLSAQHSQLCPGDQSQEFLLLPAGGDTGPSLPRGRHSAGHFPHRIPVPMPPHEDQVKSVAQVKTTEQQGWDTKPRALFLLGCRHYLPQGPSWGKE